MNLYLCNLTQLLADFHPQASSPFPDIRYEQIRGWNFGFRTPESGYFKLAVVPQPWYVEGRDPARVHHIHSDTNEWMRACVCTARFAYHVLDYRGAVSPQTLFEVEVTRPESPSLHRSIRYGVPPRNLVLMETLSVERVGSFELLFPPVAERLREYTRAPTLFVRDFDLVTMLGGQRPNESHPYQQPEILADWLQDRDDVYGREAEFLRALIRTPITKEQADDPRYPE